MDHSLKATSKKNRLSVTGTIDVPANADVSVDFGGVANGIAEVHITATRFGKARTRDFTKTEVNATLVTPKKVDKVRIIVNRCEISFLMDVTPE